MHLSFVLWALKHSGLLTDLLVWSLMQSLPFLGWAFLTRRISPWAKLGCAVSYALGTGLFFSQVDAGLEEAKTLGILVSGYGYFALVALSVHAVVPWVASRDILPLPLFVAIALLCALVPALFIPTSIVAPIEVVGFELMFGMYSYCVEAARSAPRPSLRDAMFFILVNPTLVYTRRGKLCTAPTLSRGALLRIGFGLGSLSASILLGMSMTSLLHVREAPDLLSMRSRTDLARFTAYYFLLAWAFYWGQSARASVDIGLMRLAGYEIPERFRFPFLADGPPDLWRRWNTYIGSWLRIYVFKPLAVRFQRRARWARGAGSSFAIVLTFGICGVLHDYSLYAEHRRTELAVTVVFLLHGAMVVLWLVLGKALHPVGRRLSAAFPRIYPGVARTLSCLVAIALAVTAEWLLEPALGGEGLPTSLRQLLGG